MSWCYPFQDGENYKCKARDNTIPYGGIDLGLLHPSPSPGPHLVCDGLCEVAGAVLNTTSYYWPESNECYYTQSKSKAQNDYDWNPNLSDPVNTKGDKKGRATYYLSPAGGELDVVAAFDASLGAKKACENLAPYTWNGTDWFAIIYLVLTILLICLLAWCAYLIIRGSSKGPRGGNSPLTSMYP